MVKFCSEEFFIRQIIGQLIWSFRKKSCTRSLNIIFNCRHSEIIFSVFFCIEITKTKEKLKSSAKLIWSLRKRFNIMLHSGREEGGREDYFALQFLTHFYKVSDHLCLCHFHFLTSLYKKHEMYFQLMVLFSSFSCFETKLISYQTITIKHILGIQLKQQN